MKDRVQRLCEIKGVTAEIAEKEMGMSKGYISKLDKTNPTAKTLNKLTDYFGVSKEYLLTGKDPANYGMTKEEAEMMTKIRLDRDLSNALPKYFKLSEAKKKHVLELINMLSEV